MRFIVKSVNDKTVRLASNATYLALLQIVNTRNKDLISDSIYRESYDTPDGRRSRVEDQLALSYKNKCAYCERLCKADIEHYRPKRKVEDDPNHEGYYWLCYEWTNLIPSCITCNREGSKHNHFPVIGARVYHPPIIPINQINLALCNAAVAPLLNEQPYLLHPEVDRPENFFEFEMDPNGEGIRIVGFDALGRGERTIEICLLNRKEIKLDRVERVIDNFKDAIHGLFTERSNNELNDDELETEIKRQLNLLKTQSLKEDKTHTYLRKYIVASAKNFEEIVLPFLDVKVRKIALTVFENL